MKIGIMSDSHKRLDLTKLVLSKFQKHKVDFIIHAGDIVEIKTLKMLKSSKTPYQAVLGNNDNHLIKFTKNYNLHQEPYYFKINELKVKLMHYPFYLNPDANLLIYGHTHYFACEFINGKVFLNPGEVCARKKPLCECAILEYEKDKICLKRLYYSLEAKKWTKELRILK